MALLPTLWLSAALGIASVAILRFSWSRPTRSSLLNISGWSCLAGSMVLASSAYGAWGMAVSSLFAMGAGCVLLIPSLVSQPVPKRKSVKRQMSGKLAERRAIPLARRAMTFAIVGPLALITALLLSLALRSLLLWFDGMEADANVLVLACLPLIWAILVTVLMMSKRRSAQAAMLAGMAICALPISLLAG